MRDYKTIGKDNSKKMNIRERILETLFEIAVEEKMKESEEMDRAYEEWYSFCVENTQESAVDDYLNLSTVMQKEAFKAGAGMALALINGGDSGINGRFEYVRSEKLKRELR